ncbi:MAG: Nif3-like dinuclear metal center hexameric protein [Methylobacter sp.]|jgi:dinuclear metal center YbgI/SA1388 family protein|nr:Nif3-like dinuclear metal center hexameric protein [Methylobacter sp.]
MITQSQLNDYYQALLRPDTYADYCPNGLQIEGAEYIERIAFAVSATRDSINQAVENKADALVVHHGLFWTFHGAKPLTGAFAQRIFPLVKNNINLLGYHLPLDGHPDVGNAAVLGQLLDCRQQQPFGDYKGSATGIKGALEQPLTAVALQQKLEAVLKHHVILATPDNNALIRSVGIITGGANSEWRLAEKERLDAYITGEISEHDWHESQEAGLHMFAGGHNATEQFGIQALMEKTRQQFTVDCFFIDSENPA